MLTLDFDRILAYRRKTFRLTPEWRITARDDAIAFVNERGFVHFWPVRGTTLPSLWTAAAGDRPVADEHDDPGHVTWAWKDQLLGARVWYYAKVLRRKGTFISLATLPYFYALSENYGAPEEDYLQQYREGRLSWEAKTIYEALLNAGPLDTVSLRRAVHMTSRSSDSPFNRGLEALQADFKILPIGVAEAGAWRYAYVFECVHRYYPDLAEQARPIRQADARARLAELYLRSLGAAQPRDLTALFGWPRDQVDAAVDMLVRAGIATRSVVVPDHGADWLALTALWDAIATGE